MNPSFEQEFDGLVEKFAELLVGKTDPETIEKIKIWSLFNHMHKSMPNLTGHWNQTHPESKADIRSIFEDVRDMNTAFKAQQKEK
jgi:hypothetical protein